MVTPSITVQKADAEELDRMEALLKANDLPYRDVRTKPGCFFVAYADTEFIGAGGVEIHGSEGLLRSVIIEESKRGQGYGTALCDSLEDYARQHEVNTLYLLTTTAAEFFQQRGYEAIAREEASLSIQRTTEFTDLCPTSATCMKKTLR